MVARLRVVGGITRQGGGHQSQIPSGDSREEAAVSAARPLQHACGSHVFGNSGDQSMDARRMPIVSGPRRQLRLQTEHHPLAIGVLSADQRPALDAVEDQVRLRVDQRAVDPVTHLLGASKPVVIAGQKYPRRTIGRSIEELVLLAPRDAATVLGHPGFDELVGELGQRPAPLHTCYPRRPFQCQRQPGHVVVIAVGPGEIVAQPV